jgi:hypothetical protein
MGAAPFCAAARLQRFAKIRPAQVFIQDSRMRTEGIEAVASVRGPES